MGSNGSKILEGNQKVGQRLHDLRVKSPGGVKAAGSKGSNIWDSNHLLGVKGWVQRVGRKGRTEAGRRPEAGGGKAKNRTFTKG